MLETEAPAVQAAESMGLPKLHRMQVLELCLTLTFPENEEREPTPFGSLKTILEVWGHI